MIVTLSIGGMKLKLLACQGKDVLAWDTIALSPDLMNGGLPSDPLEFARVIRAAMNRTEFHGRRRVFAAIPSLYSVCRVMELPDLPGVKPVTAIPQQARRDIGYSAENSLLFWQRLGSEKNGRAFFVVSVPKEPVLSLVQAFQAAGVRLNNLETATLSLCRAVNETDAIILEIDDYGFESIILKQHIPVISRSQFAGPRPWAPESLPAHVTDALQPIIAFHDESNPNNPLSADVPFYLLGSGAAQHPDVTGATNAILGRPPADFNPPLTFPAGFPQSEFAVNIGLALKAL